jgi:guanine deaminase
MNAQEALKAATPGAAVMPGAAAALAQAPPASSFILKGDLIYSRSPRELVSVPGGLLVCEEGRSQGVFRKDELPERFAALPVRDHGDALIIPGLVDLHTHAPQFGYRGTGMDLDLLDWLQTYTYPEEARYADLAYAERAYSDFVAALAAGATTRVAVFSTVHVPATLLLMDMLETSGLVSLVGKVNMDRNAPESLREASAECSLTSTRMWLEQVAERAYRRTSPILTPRFIPSCTDELMAGLGVLQREGKPPVSGFAAGGSFVPRPLPVQSHLSESPREIAWVRELRPQASCYADAYLADGLLGGEGCPTIMAHCVYSSPEEIALLKRQGVWIAHCAESNTNLASGIAPVRTYLREGLNIGLGTDVAGGSSLSVFRAMTQSIQASKLRWRFVDESLEPLTVAEALYLATRGGGSFWGRVGSFEAGFEFDAVVLDDVPLRSVRELNLVERLERLLYADAECLVVEKYAAGTPVRLAPDPAPDRGTDCGTGGTGGTPRRDPAPDREAIAFRDAPPAVRDA